MATSKKATPKKTATKKAAPKKEETKTAEVKSVTETHKPLSSETLTPVQEQQGVESATPDAQTENTSLPAEQADNVADVKDVLKRQQT